MTGRINEILWVNYYQFKFEVNAKLKFLIKAKKHGYKIKNYCLKMIFRVNFAPDKQNA